MNIFIKLVLQLFVLLLSTTISAQLTTPELVDGVRFNEYNSLPQYNKTKKSNPSYFQGNKERKNYFEGWYFKMVSADGQSILSVIPGISLSTTGEEQHAFIQVINGKTGSTSYHTFAIADFSFSTKEFAIKIGENYFSENRVILNIDDKAGSLIGDITMVNQIPYSDRKRGKKRIMGWYGKLSFLECYHGVVSLTHHLKGQLHGDDRVYQFDSGKGYIEKDWGSSMPSAWIWIQSNNFENPETSFMISIANVPLKKKSFNGYLGFFYYQDRVYRFGTYTRSKLKLEVIDENTVKIEIKNQNETLNIKAKRNQIGLLQAPVEGNMERRIPESIDAEIEINLRDKKGNLLYSDKSNITGFELVGDIEGLIDN